MIDLEGRGCRGGFSIDELDDFIPGWREALQSRENVKLVRDRAYGSHTEYLVPEPS